VTQGPAPRPVTLVTGASAGLGVEFARQCAARGDELVLVARRRDRLEALATELGGKCHVIAADLSRPGAAQAVMGEVAAAGLYVATLVNNAGFGGGGRFAEQSLERQREMIDLNVRTLVELTHLAVGPMLERGGGAILNVASTAAFQPGPGSAVYFATKAFVLSFTEAIHEELKARGIRVSALCPGATATEFGLVAGYTGRQLERFSADAGAVVAAGLRGLDRNRAIVVPGLGNKAGTQISRLLPRAAVRRLIARLRF
jgi:hypothetical protein